MSTTPQIDPVNLAVVLSAALFSPELAQLVGPYAVILFGATLGAGWGASRQVQSSRWATAGYLAGVVGLALLVTVPASALIERHMGVELRWTLGVVAFVVGCIGRDWPGVVRWGLGLFRRWAENAATRSSDGDRGNG